MLTSVCVFGKLCIQIFLFSKQNYYFIFIFIIFVEWAAGKLHAWKKFFNKFLTK